MYIVPIFFLQHHVGYKTSGSFTAKKDVKKRVESLGAFLCMRTQTQNIKKFYSAKIDGRNLIKFISAKFLHVESFQGSNDLD